MRIFTIAIFTWSIWLAQSSATPERYASGIPSLDAFLGSNLTESGRQVLGMTGFYGQSQPQQWLILTGSKDQPGIFQEFVISDMKIKGSRRIRQLPMQDLPTIPVARDRLKYDSTVAFEIAEELALKARVGYDSVHYQLRCRDQNEEPVWMVNMLDPAGRSLGIHYISAETGLLLRSVWHKTNRMSLSESKGPDGNPVSLLYGGNVREITVSGKAGRRKRNLTRVIAPKTP